MMGWYEKIIAVFPVGDVATSREIAERIGIVSPQRVSDVNRALRVAEKYGTVRTAGTCGRHALWERLE